MAFCSSFSAKHIFCYIYNFRTLSILAYAHYVRSGSSYIHLLEVLKRCAACIRILQKCKFPSWSVLERQKAELDARLKKKVALEKKAFDKMVEYRARVEQLCCTIELNRSQLFAKMVNELEKQDKEIKK